MKKLKNCFKINKGNNKVDNKNKTEDENLDKLGATTLKLAGSENSNKSLGKTNSIESEIISKSTMSTEPMNIPKRSLKRPFSPELPFPPAYLYSLFKFETDKHNQNPAVSGSKIQLPAFKNNSSSSRKLRLRRSNAFRARSPTSWRDHVRLVTETGIDQDGKSSIKSEAKSVQRSLSDEMCYPHSQSLNVFEFNSDHHGTQPTGSNDYMASQIDGKNANLLYSTYSQRKYVGPKTWVGVGATGSPFKSQDQSTKANNNGDALVDGIKGLKFDIEDSAGRSVVLTKIKNSNC